MKEFDVLKKHDFKFNKKYGQNFIFDKNLLKAIVADAEIDKSTNVIEIGCGSGSLTNELANCAKYVVGYEIDNNLKDVLAETLSEHNNVKINFMDVMKCSLKDIEAQFDGEYVMVANLPYYITTPIIFKFLEEATKLKRLIIMVQLEVAKRLCATENTSDYGAITVSINYRGDSKITRVVKRNMFTPQPNVDSAVVRIDIDKHKLDGENQKLLHKLARSAFAMRRKTLANNLSVAFSISKQDATSIIESAGFAPMIRGEALSLEDYKVLARVLDDKIAK